MTHHLDQLPPTAYYVKVEGGQSRLHAEDNYKSNGKYLDELEKELQMINHMNSDPKYDHLKKIEPRYFDEEYKQLLLSNKEKLEDIQIRLLVQIKTIPLPVLRVRNKVVQLAADFVKYIDYFETKRDMRTVDMLFLKMKELRDIKQEIVTSISKIRDEMEQETKFDDYQKEMLLTYQGTEYELNAILDGLADFFAELVKANEEQLIHIKIPQIHVPSFDRFDIRTFRALDVLDRHNL